MSFRKNTKQNELVAKLVTGSKTPCVFCSRKVDDEIIYGKLYVIGDIQCHYFCVLLASCLIQKGKDEEGLFGFLYKDILAEVERSKKHKCSYCNRGGATLGCSVAQCRKQFHMPCGRERKAISLFYGNYKSFCQIHAPKQKITSDISLKVELRRKYACRKLKNIAEDDIVTRETDAVFMCAICYEEVPAFPTAETFWPPCCARDAWFHRSCLQRMALSAGVHYLKCPLCNDKNKFDKALLDQGYYIPDRDAAWELEQNAFAEIYERNLSCGAEECKCPMGRNHDADNGAWEIRACLLCGSTGAHAQCLLYEPDVAYVCVTCRPAAPDDLESLAKTVEAVILSEENRNGDQPRHGPVMPSRMSLRRTKRNPRGAPSGSSDNWLCVHNGGSDNVITSRRELNLKTPRKPQQNSSDLGAIRNIDNKLFSPIKLLEQDFREKIKGTGLDFDLDEEILEEMRSRFKKPRPLSEKRRIVNDIVSGVFNKIVKEPKQKEAVKEWCSPKKISEIINEETNVSQLQESAVIPSINGVENASLLIDEDKEKHDTRSPDIEINPSAGVVDNCLDSFKMVQQMSEFITDENGQSEQICNTLNAIKTNDVDKDSGLKTMDSDHVVNVNELQMQQEESAILTADDVDTASALNDENTRINDTDSLEKEDNSKQVDSDDSSSTFQLPPEFIAEESDDSIPVFNSPKKLKTFDIQKDSSLEISENDQIVNIDVVKMDNNSEDMENVKSKSPFKIKKCSFKSNPLDKETLINHNIGMDMECFKNYYLNEVDKDFKINNTNIVNSDSSVNNNLEKDVIKKRGVKRRRRLKEINSKKRKMADGGVEKKVLRYRKRETKTEKVKLIFESDQKPKRRRRRKERNKIKIQLSISDADMPVQIKWRRKQQLKLKISEIKNKKPKKSVVLDNKTTLKQYILNPAQSSSKEIIVKPEREVSPLKRKYIKHEKFSDNLVQTSLKNFFITKTPEKCHRDV